MRRFIVAVLISVACSAGLLAAESSSASYRLTAASLNSGGGAASSASYSLNASAAQEVTVGTSSSPGFVLQSGFWSFVGSGLVPVQLMVHRNPVTTGNVDLSWSGNNPPYEIFESTDCLNVFLSSIDTTSANTYENVTPPAAPLVCYNVLATAPGPAPPPNP